MRKLGYNLEIVTQEMVNAAYCAELGADTATTLTYDLGGGVTESYTQVHYKSGITALLHDDVDEIIIKAGPAQLLTLVWTPATVVLLRNLDDMTAAAALGALGAQSVD